MSACALCGRPSGPNDDPFVFIETSGTLSALVESYCRPCYRKLRYYALADLDSWPDIDAVERGPVRFNLPPWLVVGGSGLKLYHSCHDKAEGEGS